MPPLHSAETAKSKVDWSKETSGVSTKKIFTFKAEQSPTPKRRVVQEAFKVFAPKEGSKPPSESQCPSRKLQAVPGPSPNNSRCSQQQ
jgi:hypothetical protein